MEAVIYMDIQPRRKSIRLPQYDYSTCGAYFLTICTHGRENVFGDVIDKKMALNETGKIVEKCWLAIKERFPAVELDEFSIMPNHMHGIICIVGARSPRPKLGAETAPLRQTLGRIIAYFKYQSTKNVNSMRNMIGFHVWQRNYWEHIIRDERDLDGIRQYIADNPLQW